MHFLGWIRIRGLRCDRPVCIAAAVQSQIGANSTKVVWMSAWKSFGRCAGQLSSFAVLCLALPSAWSQGSSDLVSPLLVQRPTNVVAGPYNGWFLQGGVGLSKTLYRS